MFFVNSLNTIMVIKVFDLLNLTLVQNCTHRSKLITPV